MDSITQLMRKKGKRLTPQKKEVLTALQKKPQTVLQLLIAVKSKKCAIDKATVYRILTGFKELGIVKEIHLGDREAYFELTDNAHHHHLVCEECGGIEDVTLCEELLLREVKKQSSFKIKSHSLEFFGSCQDCQNN